LRGRERISVKVGDGKGLKSNGDEIMKVKPYLAALVVILIIPMISFVDGAEVYKWIDEKGNTYFTDDHSKIPEKYRSEKGSPKVPKEAATPSVENKPPPLLVTKAPESTEKEAETYFNRGVTYSERGQWDQAIADFSKAIEINPKDSELYFSRGIAYAKKASMIRPSLILVRLCNLTRGMLRHTTVGGIFI
jgi:tetratricopeptide (TPR) repeat protein